MKSLDTNTIKEMNIALVVKLKTKPKTAKTKKNRTLRSGRIKSRELVESDSDSEEKTTKTVKPTVKETKTISKDTSLLIPEIVDSGQVEFDERHRAKLSGATDGQQSTVTSSPDATTKFGQNQLQTWLSAYVEKAQTIAPGAGKTTVSATQVLKGLNYTIPKTDPASNVQSTSKDYDSMKEEDDKKAKVKIDDEGFKITQGITHRKKKKLDAHERRKIVSRIQSRELDPSGLLMDTIKIRHEVKPYGLKENEWRCYLIYLKNEEHKEITLSQMARKLIMELELKITEVELIRDCEKNPLKSRALKALMPYLKLIKQDRYKIKNLVECFPPGPEKRKHDQSVSSDSEADVKRQNRRASRNSSRESVAKTDRERSTSKQRERELKALLGVDSQCPSFAKRQSRSQEQKKVASRPYNDDSSDNRASFAEVVTPPLPRTDAYNKANSSPSEALAQNQRAKMEIARSSHDNLKACTDVSVQLEDMFVPPPFKPSGKKKSEGAIPKSSSMVVRAETSMETDAVAAPEVHKPPVPQPHQPQQCDSNEPNLVDEAGMRKWSNDMLKGHPCGYAST